MARPDIAGRGIANPIAAIWAGAMMLDHLGERMAAVTSSSSLGHLTPIEVARQSQEERTSEPASLLLRSVREMGQGHI